MKYNFNKGVILFLLLLFVGCYENQKEIALNNDFRDEIQHWYNDLYPYGLSIRTPENEVYSLGSTPLWKERREGVRDYVVAHEVPLSLTSLFQAVPLESHFLTRGSSSFSSPTSFTHLVILDDHQTDDKTGFLMTVVPSAGYYMQNGSGEEDFTYFERPFDFDGYVLYHNLTGEYSNGWKYTEGHVTHTVRIVREAERESTPLTRGFSDCVWDGFYYLILDCKDAYAGTDGAMGYKGTYCQVVDIIEVLTYTCENVSEWGGLGGGGEYDPGGGGGSSGSGDDNNNQGNKMSSKTSKLAAKHSLGDSIKKFNEVLEEILEDCGYEALYNYIVSQGKIKDILVVPSLMGVGSYSGKDTLRFGDYDFIDSPTLKHEMVHMFQRWSMGIPKYGEGRTMGMLEFEVQLLQDIHEFIKIKGDKGEYDKFNHRWGGYNLGQISERNQYLDRYYKYLSDLTHTGTGYPSSIDNNLFLEMSHVFGEMNSSYSSVMGYDFGVADYDRCIEKMLEMIEKNCNK